MSKWARDMFEALFMLAALVGAGAVVLLGVGVVAVFTWALVQ